MGIFTSVTPYGTHIDKETMPIVYRCDSLNPSNPVEKVVADNRSNQVKVHPIYLTFIVAWGDRNQETVSVALLLG